MLLEAKSLVERLSAGEQDEECLNNNDDRDFGEVLKFCSGGTISHHEMLYSDGQVKKLTFE